MALQVTVGFGIRINGQDAGITYPTLHDAEDGADHLFARGYKQVEIFRRMAEHLRLRSNNEAAA